MLSKKILFRLSPTAPPHLYVIKIKQFIEEDGYLHPVMEKLLKLLKKTRMPYVILGKLKEVYIIEDKEIIIDRSLEPLTTFSKTDISDKGKKQLKEDKQQYYKDLIKFYSRIGYEVFEEDEISEKKISDILELIKNEKK